MKLFSTFLYFLHIGEKDWFLRFHWKNSFWKCVECSRSNKYFATVLPEKSINWIFNKNRHKTEIQLLKFEHFSIYLGEWAVAQQQIDKLHILKTSLRIYYAADWFCHEIRARSHSIQFHLKKWFNKGRHF